MLRFPTWWGLVVDITVSASSCGLHAAYQTHEKEEYGESCDHLEVAAGDSIHFRNHCGGRLLGLSRGRIGFSSATKSKEHRLCILRQRSAVASLYLGQKGQDSKIEHSACKVPFPTV